MGLPLELKIGSPFSSSAGLEAHFLLTADLLNRLL